MSTVNRIAHDWYASVTVECLQNVAGQIGGDGHSDTRGMIQAPSQLHASSPPLTDATSGNAANDNGGWEGGFEGHLGVYRRD